LGQLNQADFIKLLTAQLQNQDPTSPTKPQDLANEFAQLSTVSGINSLNQKVSQIQGGAGAAQIGQAALLIGKTVTVAGGSTVTSSASGMVNGAFSLAAPASGATVSIIDPATGKLVQQISLSNLPAGMSQFSWNGATPSYAYQYDVTATNGTAPVQATTYSSGSISSVNLAGGTPTLTMAGATQPIDLSQIVSIIGG
jgi:flagellar basal-body rod modification protein FlgD